MRWFLPAHLLRHRSLALAAAALAVLGGCGGGAKTTPSGQGTGPGPAVGRSSTTRPPSLRATLTPWTLPAAVSRPVVLNLGGQLDILGGLATGDVSTDAIVSMNPTSGTTNPGGKLEEGVHDAAGAVLHGTAMVFGGGSYTDVATVQGWTPGAPAAVVVGNLPVARSDLAVVEAGATAYVLGGFDGTAMVGSILATQDGVHFKVVGELSQPVRYAGVTLDGSGGIWVIGGELGTSENADAGGASTDIQRFDPATGMTSVVAHLPLALGHDQALFLGGRIYVTGGRTATGPSAAIWEIDPTTGTVVADGSLPGPRSDAGAVVIGGVGYLVGGEVSGPTAPLDTVVQLKLERQ